MKEIIDGNLTPCGYTQMTSLASAVPLAMVPGAQFALIQAQDKDVRWRDDGTNPTTTVGIVLAASDSIWYTGDLKKFRVIETAASAKLNITYYRG